jgi:hypothetical protein
MLRLNRNEEWYQDMMERVFDKLGGRDGVIQFLSGQMPLTIPGKILPIVELSEVASHFSREWVSTSVIESENDSRIATIRSVDFNEVDFVSCLQAEDNGKIAGAEFLDRLKKLDGIRLGIETQLALFREDDHKTLKWIWSEKGIKSISFFGTVLQGTDTRLVPWLVRSEGKWGKGYYALDYNHDLEHEYKEGMFAMTLPPHKILK